MTDQHPDHLRAEQALRDALSGHADTLEPVPLDTSRRARRWPLLLAGAAAAAVVAVAATFAVLGADEDTGSPDPAAVGTDSSTAEPTQAPPGTRIVGYRALEIAVPEDWVKLPTPNGNGCDYPSTPFVATYDPTQAFTDNLCLNDEKPRPPEGFPTAKRGEWSPNVQLLPVSAAAESLADGSQTFQGWTLTRATVEGIRIEILTDEATADVVQPILDSARTVEADPSGCDTTSPAQAAQFVRPPAFDVTTVATVTSIAVCQYARGDTASPGLTASTLLTGAAAQAELEAIQAAPTGGGPDHPENCIGDYYGDSALVLRLASDVAGADGTLGDLYVYYDWCFGNGIDDGTTRRTITEADCAPLFAGDVQQFSGDGSTFALCHPDS